MSRLLYVFGTTDRRGTGKIHLGSDYAHPERLSVCREQPITAVHVGYDGPHGDNEAIYRTLAAARIYPDRLCKTCFDPEWISNYLRHKIATDS